MNIKKNENLNIDISNLLQIRVIMQYTLLDYLRSRRFLILNICVILISIIVNIIGDMMFVWAEMAPLIAVFSAIFFGNDAIVGEFQNSTGYFIIPNPIHRTSIFFGKLFAAFFASSLILGLYTLITLGSGIINSNICFEFGLSVLFTWFFLISVLSCVFFFSAISKNILMSIFLDIIILLWLNIMILNISGLVPFEPWFILTYGGQIINNILVVPYPPHIVIGPNPYYPKFGGASITVYNPTIIQGLILIGIYTFIPIILGLIVFKKREF